jgi:putative RecB family exonuclease
VTFPLPSSLSPSKVSSFKDCPLAFRFSAIDRLPEPPSPSASKGTLVHKALELLFSRFDPGGRSESAALSCLDDAWGLLADDPDLADLDLSEAEWEVFRADARRLVTNYLQLEDPNAVRVMGTELLLEADLGSMLLRGIIDRLELDEDGGLVVTDYKTGRVPHQSKEQSRLGGVHFYAYLCERTFGVRPSRVQLLYLSEPLSISTIPSPQSIRAMEVRAGALWAAVERACRDEDFRPSPSALCGYCAYQRFCPAFGGDPSAAAGELSKHSDASAGCAGGVAPSGQLTLGAGQPAVAAVPR